MTMKRILFLFSMVTVTLAISIPGIPGKSAVSGFGIPKVGSGLDFKGAANKMMNIAGKGSGASNIGSGLDFKGAANKLIELNKRNKNGKGLDMPDFVSNTHSEGENPKEKLQNAMKYSKDAMKVINTMKSYKGKSDNQVKKSQSSNDHGEDQRDERKVRDRKSRRNMKNGESRDDADDEKQRIA